MKVVATIIVLILNLHLKHGVMAATNTTTANRIQNFGYSSETHTVVTEDGYVLTIFRIKKLTGAVIVSEPCPRRPVVLLMHGLLSSSDSWVINGPSDALSLNLVDSGYDVWLGNGRGTTYGSRHLTMGTYNRKFWRFSWHEIGAIDLPATIDYILQETGQSSLHYVGHSQGTTVLLVLLSTQPEYNQKLKTSHLLAPIAFMKYARAPGIRLLKPVLGSYNPFDRLYGDTPFLQATFLLNIIGKCRNPDTDENFCAFLLFTGTGGLSVHVDENILGELFTCHPSSSSTHQYIHLVQLYASGHFRQYDYGVAGNMQRYNLSTPPDYDLSNINPRFPLNLYYSGYDELTSTADVEHLSQALGNRAVKHFIDLENFVHIDFMWASDIKDIINRDILRVMNDAEVLLQKESAAN